MTNWFAVKMIFQIEDREKTYSQFDEQIRLIDAINEDLAIEMAYQFGMMQYEEASETNHQKLKWKFIAVTEIQHLGDIEHGKEIHYQITEPKDINLYLQTVNEKAQSLKTKKTTKIWLVLL